MLYQLETEESFPQENETTIDHSQGDGNAFSQLEHQVLEHHLSYNAMYGTTRPTTIRIRVQIQGMEIQALIDGVSSDSFIQLRIANFLNIPMQPTLGFRVMLGNFELMTIEGYIPSLEVMMQGYKVQIPKVYVVNVVGGDLVIGTTWLK